jgi:tetratricopeptide (TPR) repeat protein
MRHKPKRERKNFFRTGKQTESVKHSLPATTSEVPLWLRLSPLYLVVAIAALYFKVVSFDLIHFDDTELLRNRYFIIGDISNIKLAFTTDAFLGTSGSFYRPLQTISIMLDAFIGGPGPFVFHLTNLILHIIGTLCVYWLLITLQYKRLPVLLISLIYAAHPLFVSTVAWIPTRGDLLLTIFSVLSFILFIRSFKSNSYVLLILHDVAFFLALLSKETAVVVPVLCLIYYYFELRRDFSWRRLYPYLAVWVIGAAAWYYLRSLLPSAELSGAVFGLKPFIQNMQMIPETLGKYFLPIHFSLIPQYNQIDTLLGLAAGIGVGILAARSKNRTNKRILLGALWFLVCTAPVMMFRNSDAQYGFDYLYHRSYITSIGLTIITIELAARMWKQKFIRHIQIGAVVVLVYCAVVAFRELYYYADPEKFYTEAMERSPGSALCYNNRGVYYGFDKKDKEAALKDFTKALQIFPRFALAMCNRGLTYGNLGKYVEAKADYEAAAAVSPNDANVIVRLGDFRYLTNDFAAALQDYSRLLAANKLYPRIFSKKAGAEAMLGQVQQALIDAQEALRLDPKDEEAYNSRGLAKRAKGELGGAIEDFNKAIDIKEDYSRPYNNRGVVYFSQGSLEQALGDFDKAINMDTAYADAYSNRGSVKHRLNRPQEALTDLDVALRINPSFADAYQNRGVVRNVLTMFGDALTDFNEALRIKPTMTEAYFGRGISKFYLQDRPGACKDWKEAKALGSQDAGDLSAQYCR